MDKGARKISSEETYSITNLNSEEMLVFPKAFKFNLKTADDPIDYNALEKMNEDEQKTYFAKREEYLKPVKFEINTLAKEFCSKLATKEGSLFGSYEFFVGRNFNPSEKCLVVEIKKFLPKAFGKKVLEVRRDDLLKARIYLAENLKPYGKKVFLAVQMGRDRFREVDILNSENDTLSSELDLIPIDLPNPLNFTVRENIKPVEDKVVRVPSDLFVIASTAKLFKPCQKGIQIDYRDIFGNPVSVDWCQGEAWPRTINTPRFFAFMK